MANIKTINISNSNNVINIEIQLVNEWSVTDIVDLYKSGGWWKESYDSNGISKLITGSFAFAVAVDVTSNKAIGMGRVISDGISDAYIQDVVVLKKWRGRGIGVAIVKYLLRHCLDKKLLWIGLIAEQGTETFYTPLGFKPFPGKPMVLQKED